jgi:Tfp pilus assembly protein PilN
MIEVNLLPEDRRPVVRTPLPRFLTILGGVAAFCIEALFLVLFLWKYPRKEAELQQWVMRENRAETDIKRVREIEGQMKALDQRKAGVEKLYNDRRMWAPFLYRLCDPEVLPPQVWYRDIRLEKGRGRDAGEGVAIEGYAWAKDSTDRAAMFREFTDFVRNLQIEHPMFSEYLAGRPEIVRSEIQKLPTGRDIPESAPKEALAFELRLPLKSTTPAAATRGRRKAR